MVSNMLKCFYKKKVQNIPLNHRFYVLIIVYLIRFNLGATKMPEVWHIQALQNQNLEFYINNMHSSSSITTFYITFQKISHGL